MPRTIMAVPQTRDIFSYQSLRDNEDVAARRSVSFVCPRGHEFEVPFADDVNPPAQWECRQHGIQAATKGVAQQPPPRPRKTHWVLLMERRTERELATLLQERLTELRNARRLVRAGAAQ
jgi:RNA polymerase-binding protein